MCTRPRIFPVPTPTALPANRVSMSLRSPHFSAVVFPMIDICAPESMKAGCLTPFTVISTYSIDTVAKASGLCSIAFSKFSSMFFCRMISSSFCCTSMFIGSSAARRMKRSSSSLRFWAASCNPLSALCIAAISRFLTASASTGGRRSIPAPCRK